MDKERFSLLLLEPGEIYFEDFSCVLHPDQPGRLKLCSKSIVFEPKTNEPLFKIALKDCHVKSHDACDNELHIDATQYVEMLARNELLPYKTKSKRQFQFRLNYTNLSYCLTQIEQLKRAATLSIHEQNSMIAAIAHSRHARFAFDLLWMDLTESILIEKYVDKIDPLVVNPGRMVISSKRVYFQPFNNVETYLVLKIDINNVIKVNRRRFLLRYIGLELEFKTHTGVEQIYVAFRNQEDREELCRVLFGSDLLQLRGIKPEVMTLQWQNRVISNYDYLLYLNSLGDRSFNDLTQYPVFPWVLNNYESNELDLNDPTIYRDLSKPVGMLNPERFDKLKERYDEMAEPKFMYGSHYSAPGLVLFYLVRKYPQYMLCLQNGRFDHPDRMFNSVADVYRNCLVNMSDFKELIPEFYDVAERGAFLVNCRGIQFGTRSDGTKVGDVKLPKWAESPSEFVRTLRNALESDVVSNMLNEWIDLIFGCKQRGEQAVRANNVFYHLCYEGAIDINAVKELADRHALEVQIMEFGQIPKQVFTVPHPKRSRQVIQPITTVNGFNMELKGHYPGHRGGTEWIIFDDNDDSIISVGQDSLLKIFSTRQMRQIRSVSLAAGVLSSCLTLPDGNTLVVSCWDDHIIFYDVECSRVICRIRAHEDAVACLAWAGSLNLLASGCWDGWIYVWKNVALVHQKTPRLPADLHARMEVDAKVTCLVFNASNSILACATVDGDIHLYDTHAFRETQRWTLNQTICAVSFSPHDDKLIVAGVKGLIKIYDASTSMVLFERTLDVPVNCLCWAGNFLYVGVASGIHVWDMLEVKFVKGFDVGGVTRILARNDLVVCVGEDGLVKIWRICDDDDE